MFRNYRRLLYYGFQELFFASDGFLGINILSFSFNITDTNWIIGKRVTILKWTGYLGTWMCKLCFLLQQKQPFRGALLKRFSENMKQIYRRTPMPKCDFNKVASNFTEIALQHWCSPVNLLHIFRTPFPFLKNTSEWLLLLQQILIEHLKW